MAPRRGAGTLPAETERRVPIRALPEPNKRRLRGEQRRPGGVRVCARVCVCLRRARAAGRRGRDPACCGEEARWRVRPSSPTAQAGLQAGRSALSKPQAPRPREQVPTLFQFFLESGRSTERHSALPRARRGLSRSQGWAGPSAREHEGLRPAAACILSQKGVGLASPAAGSLEVHAALQLGRPEGESQPQA